MEDELLLAQDAQTWLNPNMENQGVEPAKKNVEKNPLAKPEFVDPSEERVRDEEIRREVPPHHS